MSNLSKSNQSGDGQATADTKGRKENVHVLSVGPLDRGNLVYEALFEAPDILLSIALDYRDLWVILEKETVQVVILHDTLSVIDLDEASRFIRRRWPHVRILLLHTDEDCLDDALYDDRRRANRETGNLTCNHRADYGRAV